MSTSVVHRRANANFPVAPKGQTNGTTIDDNGTAHDSDSDRDKRSKTSNLKGPALAVVLFTLLLLLGVTCILPAEHGPSELLRNPSPPVNLVHDEQERDTHKAQASDQQSSRGDSQSVNIIHKKQKRDDNNKVQAGGQNSKGDGTGGAVHHMIFSTGCSLFQDWQSYMFFFHAFKVGQPGYVTRIASGCKPDQAEELKRLHKERIEIMSDRFRLHLTPEFSKIKKGTHYKFFNKPFGVRHWFEHELGYPNSTVHDDDIVILLDPDQMLLRPLVNDFESSAIEWKQTKEGQTTPRTRVEHGFPAGQVYGYGAQWKTKVNVTFVVGPNSPIENISIPEARAHYPLGPPYIATARDFYQIAIKWTDFVPRVHESYPHLLAEMFAYSLAAAHLRLPHQAALSFMVSDVTSGIEGFRLVDAIPEKDVCHAGLSPDSLPHVLHYCQRYWLGKWFIGKYRLPKSFLSCEAPLLMEPPDDIGTKYDYYIAPYETEKKKLHRASHAHRYAFMICTLIRGLNEASTYFKMHNCGNDTKASDGGGGSGRGTNWNKTLIFHNTIKD